MNDALRLLLLLIAAGALWVVLQPLVFYPCHLKEWRYAFGAEHRDSRTKLVAAARQLDDVQRKEREIRNASRKQNADIDSQTKETIRGYQQERDALLDPGPGKRLTGEGGMELYERRLVFLKEQPDGEPPAVEASMPLAGLTITRENSSGRIWLTAESQGVFHSKSYPETREVAVRHLYDAIRSEAHEEGIAAGDREDEASRLTSEIRRAETEAQSQTAKVENAQAERIAALQPERKLAEDDFDVQCSVWEDETGRRPHPRWCRWSGWWWRR